MKSEGECKYCKKTFSAIGMPKHLLVCAERDSLNSKGENTIFLIRACTGPFFVYFEVKADSTLEEVDEFLRDLWLDCCGHLSAFKINNMTYYSSCEDAEPGDKTMDYKLSSVVNVGSSFFHEYDFGTTTYLGLKVIQKRNSRLKKIEVIARNNLPDFKCKCGSKAENICPECIWEGNALLCSKCAQNHECGDKDFMLPVVNSPRMGMCGYTGPD
ncbi:hypothetical protein HZA97_07215 [Candidatus Woesearchaeota archaeon]|nr:hypothetical protein [Candidatus Woesearchaeota archaeon]